MWIYSFLISIVFDFYYCFYRNPSGKNSLDQSNSSDLPVNAQRINNQTHQTHAQRKPTFFYL
jgi:hypothetical protein